MDISLIDLDFDSLQVSVLVFTPETQTQQQCISISIIDDLILEDTEMFNVLLNSSVNERVNLGSPSTVSILDNDGLLTHFVKLIHFDSVTTHIEINVRFEQNTYIASENVLMMDPEVCVVVDVPFERPFMVRVTTLSGTATGNNLTVTCAANHVIRSMFDIKGGEDFMDISEPLVFEPSEVPRVCSVIIILSDDILEEMEFFTVTLSSPLHDDALLFTDPNATVTIIDTSCKYYYSHITLCVRFLL